MAVPFLLRLLACACFDGIFRVIVFELDVNLVEDDGCSRLDFELYGGRRNVAAVVSIYEIKLM